MNQNQKPPEGGVNIGFVGEVIKAAVDRLKERQDKLPPDARQARQAVQIAIEQLEKTSEKIHEMCRSWFMSPK